MSTFNYAELQQVAVDLLAEFGQQLAFLQPQNVFDPITSKNTGGTPVTVVTVGVLVDQRVSLIDGTRIPDGRRVLLLDPTVTPEMSWKWKADVVVAAPYDAIGLYPGNVVSTGQQGDWPIVEIKELKPAETILLYEVQLEK